MRADATQINADELELFRVTLSVALIRSWEIARANKPCLKNPLHLLGIPSIPSVSTYQPLAGDRPTQI